MCTSKECVEPLNDIAQIYFYKTKQNHNLHNPFIHFELLF